MMGVNDDKDFAENRRWVNERFAKFEKFKNFDFLKNGSKMMGTLGVPGRPPAWVVYIAVCGLLV